MKKKGIGSEVRAERLANADADLQLLGEAERGRQLQKQKKRRLQGREDEVCYISLIILVFRASESLYLVLYFSRLSSFLVFTLCSQQWLSQMIHIIEIS